MWGEKVIHVAAAIIYQSNKVLICQRAEGGSCPLLWEFPGGKLEPDETIEDCVARECKEELDIEIRPLTIYQQMSYQYPEREIYFTFFVAEIVSGEIKKNVHREIRWVAPSELEQYEFCPADVEIARKLAKANKIEYNKLVRDKIPEIIAQSEKHAICITLSDGDYLKNLDVKLIEEMKEYQESKSPEELADIIEVIYAIARARGTSVEELERICADKAKKRGGFQNRVFLKQVIED